MKKAVNVANKTYKIFLSRAFVGVFGGGCRYTPTCSEYSKEAVEKYGIVKGIVLSIRRLVSCHPFSSRSTFDPLK